LKKLFTLELLEEHERINIYSVHQQGEEFSEFENFLNKFKETHPKDVGKILYRLERIINDGVFDRHFRYAGKMRERVRELPANIDTAKLRVYCLCISEQILILGNGGVKSSKTYNEDPQLNSYVEILQAIDQKIKNKQKHGQLQISGRELIGSLTIEV